MSKLSVLVITKNEEEHLSDCLESVRWADEIVVVDSGSTDKTEEIAKKYTKEVYYNEWLGYSEQKNWGAQKCRNDWVLCLDADERISLELRTEIEEALEEKNFNGYFLPTKDFIFGKWILHGKWSPQEHIRLYKKSKGSWTKDVHEVVQVNGGVGHLKNPILHVGHTDVSEFISKLNLYTQKEADDRFKAGEKISIGKLVFNSFRAFLREYVKGQGYKDGEHGFVLAVLMSFYQFSKDVKLWEHWYKKGHT
ncbi:MAG: glycosyltransferase family 2 protein [Patescibacteria group bacterium]|nr:glycosyltransferase family 2 protein [Patescibacteria group bacterium]